MIILGIETATAVCGVAILRDNILKTELHIEAPQAHSEKLLTMVEDALHSSGMKLDDVDAIACSIGPGSFTGLRIGLSVAKGLAYAAEKPLIAVSTLEALAQKVVTDSSPSGPVLIVPMIDARRDEVYYAGYRWLGNGLDETMPPDALRISELFQKLQDEKKVVLIGDGAEKFSSVAKGSPVFTMVPKTHGKCSAVSVAMLGLAKWQQGKRDDIVTLEPMYVKEFYTTMNISSPQTA